jgi:hypothetical protein
MPLFQLGSLKTMYLALCGPLTNVRLVYLSLRPCAPRGLMLDVASYHAGLRWV